MSAAFLLICAMCLDAALGEPDWLWSRIRHPAVMIGNGIAWLDKRLNHGTHRRLKGLAVAACLVLTAVAAGKILSVFGPLAEIVICAVPTGTEVFGFTCAQRRRRFAELSARRAEHRGSDRLT